MNRLKTFKSFNSVSDIIFTISEKHIIDDIFSSNENIGTWWDKFVDYGKKGLLTATILLSIAFSAQAQQQNKSLNVINQGTQMMQSNDKKDVYSFFVGISSENASLSMQRGDIDSAGGFKEITKYYENLRDNKLPEKLSQNAIKCLQVIKNLYNKLDKNDVSNFIQNGKIFHTID